MTEERTTRVDTPEGDTHTTTTVVHDEPRRGVGMWLVLLVIVIGAIVGIYLFAQGNNSEIAKDNAIADAANQVGDAAQQAGDAVETAADEVTNNN